MKKQKSAGDRILSVLLCLTLAVGMLAMDGYAFTTGLDTPPAADAGAVSITLEVGTASVGNTLMEAPGFHGALDFSAVVVDGAPVGTDVRSVAFQDLDPDFTPAPAADDLRKVTLNNAPPDVDVVYARHVGEGGFSGGNNVVAYLVKAADAPRQFDMFVCGPGGVTAPADSSGVFSKLILSTKPSAPPGAIELAKGWQAGLERVDLTHFDTSQAEDLAYAFGYCENLTADNMVGVQTMALDNARRVRGMFQRCAALTEIDLSAWSTPKLEDVGYLFGYCTNLVSVNVTWPKENLANVTRFNNLFYENTNLTTITGVDTWELPNATEMRSIFYKCESLESLDLRSWQPHSVVEFSHVFNGTSNLKSLDVSGWGALPNLEAISSTFVGTGLEEIDLSGWTNCDKLYYFYGTFQLARNLKTVKFPQGVGEVGYPKVEFYVTFGQAEVVKDIDLSGWVFDSEKHLNYDRLGGMAFWGNEGSVPKNPEITADDIVIKKDAKIQTAKFPWVNSSGAKPVVISANRWNLNDTEQDLSNLFNKIPGKTDITDFSGWTGLAGVTNTSDMFKGATLLETVDLSGADFSSLTSAVNMFGGAPALTQIDLRGVTGITGEAVLADMFSGVGAGVTLLADDDEIGQWIKAAFASRITTRSVSSELPENESLLSAPEAAETPELPEVGQIDIDLSEEDRQPTPEGDTTIVPYGEAFSRYAAGNAKSAADGGAVTVHPDKTPAETELSLLTTVRFEETAAAPSGQIELNVPLPANIAVADVPNLKISTFKRTDSGIGAPDGGTVTTAPEIRTESGVQTLHAAFEGMEPGTEIEVSFDTKLAASTIIAGRYLLWDPVAFAQEADTQAAASTLYLWDSAVLDIPPTIHTVAWQLTNVTAQPQPAIAAAGEQFHITLKPDSGMAIKTVSVDMNGVTLTDVYDSTASKIEIAAVDGDINIKADAAATGGGSGGGGSSNRLTVKYDIDSSLGSTKDRTSESLNSGAKPQKVPVVTVKDAEKDVFVGWTLDPKAERITLTDPEEAVITKDTTFYAMFAQIEKHGHYIKGYDSGIFAPTDNISRAQVAAIIARACLDGFNENNNYGNGGYSDVAGDHWAAGAIAYCAEKGVLVGVGEGMFEPERSISRQEFALVFARMAGLMTTGDMPFTDAGTTADWAMSGVYTAFTKGWLDGYADGTFKPWNSITRSEAVKIVNRYLNRGVDKNGIANVSGDLKQWPDVPESYWAYYEIMEASNDHTFYFANGANPPEVYTKAYVEQASLDK